jgi:hypothetical protein
MEVASLAREPRDVVSRASAAPLTLVMNFGMAMVAMTAWMTTAMTSSKRVKPRRRVRVVEGRADMMRTV